MDASASAAMLLFPTHNPVLDPPPAPKNNADVGPQWQRAGRPGAAQAAATLVWAERPDVAVALRRRAD
eukprot:251974-Chlamydomonas_euryale.AAC.2